MIHTHETVCALRSFSCRCVGVYFWVAGALLSLIDKAFRGLSSRSWHVLYLVASAPGLITQPEVLLVIGFPSSWDLPHLWAGVLVSICGNVLLQVL
jgi:hypothetical protein